MADVAIRANATQAAPADYVIPGAQEILPKAVNARMDGSAAGSAWYPCLQVLDPSGAVMFDAVATASVAAGASVDVSWFPHLAASSNGGGGPQALVGALIRAGAAGQNIPNDTNTDLTYSAVEFDTNGMANLASNNRILTVNTGGYYLVMCGTIWGYNNSGRRINLIFQNTYYSTLGSQSKVADSIMEPWDPFPGEGVGGSADNISARVLHASVGDFFSSGVYQNSGATITCNSGPNPAAFLSATLIGV